MKNKLNYPKPISIVSEDLLHNGDWVEIESLTDEDVFLVRKVDNSTDLLVHFTNPKKINTSTSNYILEPNVVGRAYYLTKGDYLKFIEEHDNNNNNDDKIDNSVDNNDSNTTLNVKYETIYKEESDNFLPLFSIDGEEISLVTASGLKVLRIKDYNVISNEFQPRIPPKSFKYPYIIINATFGGGLVKINNIEDGTDLNIIGAQYNGEQLLYHKDYIYLPLEDGGVAKTFKNEEIIYNKNIISGTQQNFALRMDVDSEDNLYVCGYDIVVKVDPMGNTLWESRGVFGDWVSDIEYADGKIYAGVNTKQLVEINTADGSIINSRPLPVAPQSIFIDSDVVYVSDTEDSTYYRLDKKDLSVLNKRELNLGNKMISQLKKTDQNIIMTTNSGDVDYVIIDKVSPRETKLHRGGTRC